MVNRGNFGTGVRANHIPGSAEKGAIRHAHLYSDLIIPRLVTNKTAKICCCGLMLALFYSTMVIKKYFG